MVKRRICFCLNAGLNLVINDLDMPWIIKVASIPKERIQVYFIDNEEYFKRKDLLLDKNENLLLQAYAYTSFNLLVLNPIYYDIIEKHLITNTDEGFNFLKYFCQNSSAFEFL